MTTEVVSVRPEATVGDAVDLLETHGISGMPVVDDGNRLLGVITEYDLLRGIDSLQMRGSVADFMTPDPITVGPNTPLAELAKLFVSSEIRRVPVVDEGRLVGIVARRDLVFAGNICQQLSDLPVLADIPPGQPTPGERAVT